MCFIILRAGDMRSSLYLTNVQAGTYVIEKSFCHLLDRIQFCLLYFKVDNIIVLIDNNNEPLVYHARVCLQTVLSVVRQCCLLSLAAS